MSCDKLIVAKCRGDRGFCGCDKKVPVSYLKINQLKAEIQKLNQECETLEKMIEIDEARMAECQKRLEEMENDAFIVCDSDTDDCRRDGSCTCDACERSVKS